MLTMVRSRIGGDRNNHPLAAASAASCFVISSSCNCAIAFTSTLSRSSSSVFARSKLNFKPAGGNAKIDWHQDWAFYPHTNDDLLALGVMIEDCTAENGPLMVIPGSHRGPLYNHHRGGIFVGAIDPVDLGAAAGRAVELTARAGSISIHHVRTVHASRDNLTATERPLLLLSYAAADAFPVFYGPDLAEFNARILRGAATLDARITDVPIRLPLPRAKGVGSIYDNQEMLARIAAGADLELDTMPERR